jgi:hypothetical protein
MTHFGVVLGLGLLAAGEPGATVEPVRVSARQMDIPFRLDPASREEVRELSLYVSRDEGKSWTLAATARPEEERFPFKAPKDGAYWFAVRTTTKAGANLPADLARLVPTLKVLVEAAPAGGPKPPTPTATTAEEVEQLKSRLRKLEKRVKELENRP